MYAMTAITGKDGGDPGPATEGLLAGNLAVIARNQTRAGDLCVVSSGNDGAGFEHIVRGRCL